MFAYLILFGALIASAEYTVAQKTYSSDTCSRIEINCGDGSCVKRDSRCDGVFDCLDGRDELDCALNTSGILGPVSANSSQLTQGLDQHEEGTELRKDQWRCANGTRIPISNKCDGKEDCPDGGSDETFALCWKNKCAPNQFRCIYGACVDGMAPCNGVNDCADKSDELIPRCQDETHKYPKELWQCQDGQKINIDHKCDGIYDCDDSSDETFAVCKKNRCAPNQFRCTYGGCVHGMAPCNDRNDCIDKSDENLPRCRNETDQCGPNQFRCTNGACVDDMAPCNGVNDCADKSDELLPGCKGQSKDRWQCQDGRNINIDHKCDGKYDCVDRSDEIFALCGKNRCAPNQFRCTYGACVDGMAPCNGVIDCADKSDEFLPGCRKETDEYQKDLWQCQDGLSIYIDNKCDGIYDCDDRSDETFALCRKNRCAPNQFRCTYGGCVYGMAPCNGRNDCIDKSDENLPRCRNETDEYQDQFLCSDGNAISAHLHCNGNINCPDGSDETLRACVATKCAYDQFQCAYGACVERHVMCNGKQDCADGSDELELLCENHLIHLFTSNTDREDQWQCQDGTIIPIGSKCDGKVDCPDRTEETHAICRTNVCEPYQFRCTYGACVDGMAPCNGRNDCVDKSDELLPRCQNDTKHFQGQFFCRSGDAIPAHLHCDGKSSCWDESDETLRACAAKTCASDQFQCMYGACVDKGSECNGKRDCADGSDELEELCDSINYNSPTHADNCTLPLYPEHGIYVSNQPNATPGQVFASLHLNVTCHQGYGVLGTSIVSCQDGAWSHSIPKCVRLCKLFNDPSVHYYCPVTDSEDRRDCNSYEPSGTEVKPECNRPNYYSPDPLNLTRCIDGSWDYVPVCKPECGRVTPDGVTLIIDGRPAKRGELPWHVGIYRKTEPYMQICGGSLVSNSVVISAAHCFWNDVSKQQPASKYAVAVGKIHRAWNNDGDVDAQKSDVKEIKIPARFQGSATNFQDDIAVIILETAFVYQTFVRPVCLDFDLNFDGRQLQPGNLGKVAGWGLTAEDGQASEILKVVEMPYVDIKQCIRLSPLSFREYITSDKICSGYANGTALCKGDSGGGLAFLEGERYYLRGIVSAAPKNDHLCNSNTLTTFTKIIKHEHFIKNYLVSN